MLLLMVLKSKGIDAGKSRDCVGRICKRLDVAGIKVACRELF